MNQCKNCQYFREGGWCSNSQSPNFRFSTAKEKLVSAVDTCSVFYTRGKKAPAGLRAAVNLLQRLSK